MFQQIGDDGTQYAELEMMRSKPSEIHRPSTLPRSIQTARPIVSSGTTIYAQIDYTFETRSAIKAQVVSFT